MGLHVHVHHPPGEDDVVRALRAIDKRIGRLEVLMTIFATNRTQEESFMSQTTDQLIAVTNEQTTIKDSLNILIPGLLAKYEEYGNKIAAAAGDEQATMAAVAELQAHNQALKSVADQIVAAVSANTGSDTSSGTGAGGTAPASTTDPAPATDATPIT